VYDYAKKLGAARAVAAAVVADSVEALAGGGPWLQCLLLNESVCEPAMAPVFSVAIFNPMAANASMRRVMIPVYGSHAAVVDSATGQPVTADVFPNPFVANYPGQTVAPYHLFFTAPMAAFGLQVYDITVSNASKVRQYYYLSISLSSSGRTPSPFLPLFSFLLSFFFSFVFLFFFIIIYFYFSFLLSMAG
jgi:hypothetical protein